MTAAAAVTVRFWAAARAAAGTAEESYADAATLAALLAAAAARHGADLARVLERCSYLVDEQPVGSRDRAHVLLAPGAVIDVLPPFAGGSGTIER